MEAEYKEKPRRWAGASTTADEIGLAGLDAAAVGVGPLVLVAESVGADEGRRVPGALVVGFVALTVVPGVEVRVRDRFARLVTDEVILIERGVAERLAAGAAGPRLNGVLDVAAAVAEVAVVGAVGQVRAAAGGGAAVGGVGARRDEDLVDRAVVEGVAGVEVLEDLALHGAVGHVGRR